MIFDTKKGVVKQGEQSNHYIWTVNIIKNYSIWFIIDRILMIPKREFVAMKNGNSRQLINGIGNVFEFLYKQYVNHDESYW